MSKLGRYYAGSALPAINRLTGDVGGAVSPDAFGDLFLLGGDNINTVGTPASNQIEVFLNEVIRWPNTNAAGTSGMLYLGAAGGVGGTRFLHNYGTNNTFLGESAGNLTLTGPRNVGIGTNSLAAITIADDIVSIGYNAMAAATNPYSIVAIGSGVCSAATIITQSVYIGTDVGSALLSGDDNVAIGYQCMQNATRPNYNVSIGSFCMQNATNSDNNVAIGYNASSSIIDGEDNVILGCNAGTRLTSGETNTIIGFSSGGFITTGDHNIVINSDIGGGGVGSESSNVYISAVGASGESNTIRIGEQGSGAAEQDRAFIAGTRGVTPAVADYIPVVIDSNHQLGTVASMPVSLGGTGRTTLTSYSVLVGAGTSAITQIAVGATGTLLGGNTGANPSFTSSSDGSFSFVSATAGTTRLLSIENTDNTNTGSLGRVRIRSGGAAAGDPTTLYQVIGTQNWLMGIDNDNNDAFSIIAGTALAPATSSMRMEKTGETNFPLQSAFLAYNAGTDVNQTGNGAVVTVEFNTEVYDQNNDYNVTTDTFTAPITGRYHFDFNIIFANIATATTCEVRLVTSNREYRFGYLSPTACKNAASQFSINGSTYADMDAADTAYVQTVMTGEAGDTVSIIGGAVVLFSFFGGKLVA